MKKVSTIIKEQEKLENSSIKEFKLSAETELKHSSFNLNQAITELKNYLPAQAPLKDFIFQNTLKAFQNLKFQKALTNASKIFGYKVFLPMEEFRKRYSNKEISEAILEKVIERRKGASQVSYWKEKLLSHHHEKIALPRIGLLRANWKKRYQIDMDSLVHPVLFRIIGSYLDQGISIWNFPEWNNGFLASIREMEKNSFTSFFRTPRAKNLLLENNCNPKELLKMVVGDPALYKQYIFDQQFAHQGWSGIVSVIEDRPEALMDTRKVTIHDLIALELLLEIDTLDWQFGEGNWTPLKEKIISKPKEIFSEVKLDEVDEILFLWQEAFEWSYYDQVLAGMLLNENEVKAKRKKSFQLMVCIDDRETSLRDYLEMHDSDCETFSTPGFFNVEFYFQPEHGKGYTKLCPAPVTPKYLIKETGNTLHRKKDVHITKHAHSVLGGLFLGLTLGFWAAFRLLINVFRPSFSPTTVSSFRHMDPHSKLSIINKSPSDIENGLQIGFTIEEMANRVEGLLRSIGLVDNFAPLVYAIGHGSTSVNNPFYATMDCGACSCRPGSVNARVFSFMANHPEVRQILASRNLIIPSTTQFVGGIHDTTTDEILCFDEDSLSPENLESHKKNILAFSKALDWNAKERSRRFESVNTKSSPEKIHSKIRTRAVSLFEPRPELDHATNALCIVGRREMTKGLFLDRRAFTNSYDYKLDPEGKYLFNILKAATPVCGDINLAFYFSRVDNQKLGAGTKLPHNVMGLFGVANGIEGDLRPGLPSQMVEAHDPVRLLMIVEHYPDVVLKTIQSSEPMYEYYINEWIHLVVIHPDNKELLLFKDGEFEVYKPLQKSIPTTSKLNSIIEGSHSLENLPVYLLK